jgi:hypothetical protein
LIEKNLDETKLKNMNCTPNKSENLNYKHLIKNKMIRFNFLFLFLVAFSSILACKEKEGGNQKIYEEINSVIEQANQLNESIDQFELDTIPDYTFNKNSSKEIIKDGSNLTKEELEAFGFK